MTIEEALERVKEIQAESGDDEYAHRDEDSLWQDVLEAIAKGDCESPKKLAEIALTTTQIKFARWFA